MFAEDLSAFTADFGSSATWSKGPTLVRGLFDSGYQAAELGMLVGVEGARYSFLCAAADMPGVAQGQQLELGGVVYVIRNVQPDGTGMLTLLLSKA